MKRNASLFTALYRLLIRLYPRSFRNEFGAEMEMVFQGQMADSSHSHFLLLKVCWRELRDWPFHCIQTHWQVRQQRLQSQPVEVVSWWETTVSSFPYFIFALFASGSILYFLFGRDTGFVITLLVGYVFVFILLLVLIFAWWRGWPVWSVTWLGFLFFLLLVFFLPVQLSNLFYQEPQTQLAQMIMAEIGFPFLWLVVLYVLLLRWPRVGLVAMLPTLAMTWFLYLEFVPESMKTAVLAATWIWLGVVAIVLLRWRHHDWDVWLLYLAGIVVGIIYIYAGHFLTEVPVRDGTPARMAEDLLSDLLPVLIPLVGILLLHTLRQYCKQNGRSALIGYRLFLAGTVWSILGVQITLRLLLRQGNFSGKQPSLTLWLTAVSLIGLLLLAAGIRRILKIRPQVSLAGGRSLWLLFGLLILLPLTFDSRWLPVIYNQSMYQQLSAEQFAQQQIERLVILLRQMSYGLGLVWLLVAAWLIGRVRRQQPPISLSQNTVTAPAQLVSAAVPEPKGRLTKRTTFPLAAALLILVALLLPPTTLAILFPNDQMQPFDLTTSLPLFLVMTSALVITGLLLAEGFVLYRASVRKTALSVFLLSFLLLGAALHNYYRLAVWDTTYDGLGYLWLFIPITGVFLATIWLAVRLTDKAKLVALFYLLLIPAVMIMITERAQRVDFQQVTDVRAEQVSKALSAYYDQAGHYPDNLDQLTPQHLISLSEPMIIFGQDWCYETNGEAYQLGYVYREHWSNPLLVGFITSASDIQTANLPPICTQEINVLQARDPVYYGLRYE